VPGLATLNAGGDAQISLMSCASAGSCSAGGTYTRAGRSHYVRAFVVGQQDGRWGRARPVTGTGVGTSPLADIGALSFGAAGSCGAGGFYTDRSGHQQAFVVGQT
jgi:hypothetical protein